MSGARAVWVFGGSLLGLLLVAVPAGAFSDGIDGYSGNPSTGGLICNVCHSGGVNPMVTLTGDTTAQPGTVHTYELKIRGGQQIAGGLDVSASGGTLQVTDFLGTQIIGSELTHTAPRDVDANRAVIWTFDWAVPVTPGTYTLYGAGNSVDLAQGLNGDAAAAATLTVDVVAATTTPGECSGSTLAPLLVTGYDAVTGKLSLSFESACMTDGNNIYFGPLSQVSTYGWSGEDCEIGTGPVYQEFAPGSGSFFFVVVGHDGADDGSYGLDRTAGGSQTERPPFDATLCPQQQTLVDPCD